MNRFLTCEEIGKRYCGLIVVYTGQIRTTSFCTFEDDGYLSLNLGCENDKQISI